MKKCQTCHLDNSDNMRFCVECGSPLPDAPFVINIGGSQPPPPPPSGQPNFGQFGGQQQQQQQGGSSFPNSFPNNFSNVPPPKPRSNKKMFLVIGGIFVLFTLIFVAIAGIVGYNMLKDDVVYNPTPTPTNNNNNNNSASPTPSKSPTASKTPTPTVTPKQTPSNTTDGATAELGRVWVDYNVTQGGEKGMLIHVKFTLRQMKQVDSYLAVYFEKDNGEKLYTNNKQYRSKDGQVAVFKPLKPAYDDTVYDDAQVFIPYEEFSLDSGKYNLKADIDVIYENGDMLQHMTYHDFQYTEP